MIHHRLYHRFEQIHITYRSHDYHMITVPSHVTRVTVKAGLDCGLDYGLDYGLRFGLHFGRLYGENESVLIRIFSYPNGLN